jgi:phage tail-like protein
VADSTAFWDWQRDVARGIVQARNVHIVLLDDVRAERWRWRCLAAYPVRWTGPELRASESSVAVESLELVHMGLERY